MLYVMGRAGGLQVGHGGSHRFAAEAEGPTTVVTANMHWSILLFLGKQISRNWAERNRGRFGVWGEAVLDLLGNWVRPCQFA